MVNNQATKSNEKLLSGRPTKYRKEYPELAHRICLLLNATDEQLARVLAISVSTLNEWKKKYPDFSESIREGKLIADINVAKALYDSAVGMRVNKVHFVNHKRQITAIKYEDEIPPDVRACIFWLKNQQLKLWRDVMPPKPKQEGRFSIIIHKEVDPRFYERVEECVSTGNIDGDG